MQFLHCGTPVGQLARALFGSSALIKEIRRVSGSSLDSGIETGNFDVALPQARRGSAGNAYIGQLTCRNRGLRPQSMCVSD